MRDRGENGVVGIFASPRGDRARVEMPVRPILLRARLCGSSEEMKELLVKYGATTDLDEEE